MEDQPPLVRSHTVGVSFSRNKKPGGGSFLYIFVYVWLETVT